MLNHSFIKNIDKALSKNSFINKEDFKIIQPTETAKARTIAIHYIYDENYYFKANLDNELNFYCEFKPGNILQTQKTQAINKYNYLNEIENWVDRLEDEFTSAPIARAIIHNQTEIKNLKDTVESYFKEKQLNPNEQFTLEETQNLEQQLEEFKKSIEKTLQSEMAEKQFLKNEVEKLFKEVEFLKKQMHQLTKKNWLTRFVTTTNRFIKNNPETTKAITQTAKHLLPEEIQNIIPEETNNIVDILIEEHSNN